ncbi:bacteriocin immunity protein [Pseudomonas sp.]|uniref:bacteriocin immunity protein n=1 Tax=Pseudomonas sp. TaxID=306 RepID=UPI001B05DA6A|nr:bacteriocin immunity protein [Pseudomonas sp.]MBO9550021.1 bacteriocin immunity protein [Pseudomonas sp.]
MKNSICDYTEAEFLIFVKKIYSGDYPSDQEHINAMLAFERITEHPSKSDLFAFPEAGKESPEAIVIEVKSWRAENGKPGFKAI